MRSNLKWVKKLANIGKKKSSKICNIILYIKIRVLENLKCTLKVESKYGYKIHVGTCHKENSL